MLSEGFHSSLDAGATAFTLFAVRLALKPADREHPFGHGRVEDLAALAEAIVLILLGAGIAYEALLRLREHIAVDPPWYAVALMVVSIAVDLVRSTALRRAARKYHSQALEADALNFTADLFGSSAVLVGLIAARAGFWYGDPLAALAVVGLVWVMGARLIARAVNVLMDRAAPADVEEGVRSAAGGVAGVLGVGPVRSRQSGPTTLAEVTVQVGRTRSVEDSHQIAESVGEALSQALPGIRAVVHVEPEVEAEDLVERTFAAANRIGLADQVHNVLAIRNPEGLWLTLHAKVLAGRSRCRSPSAKPSPLGGRLNSLYAYVPGGPGRHAARPRHRRAGQGLPPAPCPTSCCMATSRRGTLRRHWGRTAVLDFGLTHVDSRDRELAIARVQRFPEMLVGFREEAARLGVPLTRRQTSTSSRSSWSRPPPDKEDAALPAHGEEPATAAIVGVLGASPSVCRSDLLHSPCLSSPLQPSAGFSGLRTDPYRR